MLICAGNKAAILYSNAEAGAGFPNQMFTSEDLDDGVVIEVKCCAQAFGGCQCSRCLSCGVSFCKKLCVVKAETQGESVEALLAKAVEQITQKQYGATTDKPLTRAAVVFSEEKRQFVCWQQVPWKG